MFPDGRTSTGAAPQIGAIAITIAGISALHYGTTPIQPIWHGIYQHLYYLPIVLAAYWYGVKGGMIAATVTAALYIPHITTWTREQSFLASQYTGLAVFYVMAIVVGVLSSTQQRLVRQYREAAASLRQANEELRASFEHLQRSDRLASLGEIAAGLVHEVRNPLSAIKGAIEIVQTRAAAASPEAEFTAIAVRELGRVDSLLGEFLAYARPREPQRLPVSLSTLIDRVLPLLTPVGQRAGVRLVVTGDGARETVHADLEQLSQVLFNVLLNAIQASRQGGQVRIDLGVTGDAARIEVLDDGPGIPAHVAERIFEPFYTTKTGGTGLGLAIAHRIVSAHGGSMAVLTTGLPGGTTMRLTVPLARAPLATQIT